MLDGANQGVYIKMKELGENVLYISYRARITASIAVALTLLEAVGGRGVTEWQPSIILGGTFSLKGKIIGRKNK